MCPQDTQIPAANPPRCRLAGVRRFASHKGIGETAHCAQTVTTAAGSNRGTRSDCVNRARLRLPRHDETRRTDSHPQEVCGSFVTVDPTEVRGGIVARPEKGEAAPRPTEPPRSSLVPHH